jgi:hypothetical protein
MPKIRDRRRSLLNLGSEVWRQFFGSDIEGGYSYIYTWLANQFGHFMIGFAGTQLCCWLVSWVMNWPFILRPETAAEGKYTFLVGAGWLLFWILKELLSDIVSALRDLRLSGRQIEALRLGKAPPHPHHRVILSGEDLRDLRRTLLDYLQRTSEPSKIDPVAWFKQDIVSDSLTDSWFNFAGVVTALAMYFARGLATTLDLPWLAGALPALTFFVLLVLSVPVSAGWLWANIAFDKATLPFVSRFALNSKPPEEEKRECALDFALRNERPGHLVIIGPPKSGRTTTAVALAVEAILRSDRNIVVYTTLCKLLDRISEERQSLPNYGQQGPPGNRPVFSANEAKLVIVDDVGALGAGGEPLLSAQVFEGQLGVLQAKYCSGKRMIWVVGDDPSQSQNWKEAFLKHGPSVEEPIVMPEPIAHQDRRRPMRRA